MTGDARTSLQAGIASMSPHYVVMEGPGRKTSIVHASHVLGKKNQTKKPTNKTTHQQKSSPTSSQSVSLLELFCVIMSYWHRFCSLHERGRSRQLRVRKSQFLWKSQLLCNFFSWSTRDAQQGLSTLRRKSSFQHSGDLKSWSYASSSFCPPAANHQN